MSREFALQRVDVIVFFLLLRMQGILNLHPLDDIPDHLFS